MWLAFESIDHIGVSYGSSIGRALALAQSFEQNCKYVLLITNLDKEIEKGNIAGFTGIASYSERLENWFKLGRDIYLFKDHHKIGASEIETLRKGVAAKNYIAHEPAYPILNGSKSGSEIRKELPNFIRQVASLAETGNLIAQWSFVIQERQNPPIEITTTFPQKVTNWVLSALDKEVV